MITAAVALKGGSGKTTISLHLAGEAVRRGRRTLVADADPQRSASLLVDRQISRGIAHPTVVSVTESLASVVREMASDYDMIFIDCAPHSSPLTRAALMVADVVLMPVMPSGQDIDAAAACALLIAEARELRPELCARMVLNRMQRTAISHGLGKTLGKLGMPVSPVSVTQRVAYADTLATGRSLPTTDPEGAASLEIRALYDELLTLAPTTTRKPHGKKRTRARGSDQLAR